MTGSDYSRGSQDHIRDLAHRRECVARWNAYARPMNAKVLDAGLVGAQELERDRRLSETAIRKRRMS